MHKNKRNGSKDISLTIKIKPYTRMTSAASRSPLEASGGREPSHFTRPGKLTVCYWKLPIYSGFTHKTWWFSIRVATLNYQGVSIYIHLYPFWVETCWNRAMFDDSHQAIIKHQAKDYAKKCPMNYGSISTRHQAPFSTCSGILSAPWCTLDPSRTSNWNILKLWLHPIMSFW